MNSANERDYTSGLNVDLGPTATGQFSALNVEGRGFGGTQNLRKHESTFAGLHTLHFIGHQRQDGSLDGRWASGRVAPREGHRSTWTKSPSGAVLTTTAPGRSTSMGSDESTSPSS